MSSFPPNPFDGYGHIVRGSQFIGRRNSYQAITSRIVTSAEPGNLAIIGDHRIGKSSLAHVGIMERKDVLIAHNRVPVWINLAIFENPREFFVSLVNRSFSALDELGLTTATLVREHERINQPDISWAETFERIQRFFKHVRSTGVWMVFVLDEFDHARVLFRDSISGFQQLRSLSYDDPDGRVAFVTTSRRTIREIEEQTHSISTFDGICAKEYLGMFDGQDIEEYFAKLAATGIETTNDLRTRIYEYCGGHPYLLTCLGHKLVDNFQSGLGVDVDHAMAELLPAFLSQYDRMTRLLAEDGRINRLLQTLFGPAIDVRQTDIDDFLRYGLLNVAADGTYQAFSTHFQDYLRMVERNTELWPIWSQVEVAMRELVTKVMSKKFFGRDWVSELERSRPKLGPVFERCRDAQAKEKRLFGERASTNLIDFTYPSDLFEIMFTDWQLFVPVFGKDKNHWESHRQLLSRIRNPLAHNRNNVIEEHERLTAEGYCREILSCIQKHETI